MCEETVWAEDAGTDIRRGKVDNMGHSDVIPLSALIG
jgi:hypothetical protein